MNQPTAPEVARKPQVAAAGIPPAAAAMPNPGRLFQTFNAYQQTAAMKAAIELEVFTAIGDRKTTAAEIAQNAGASERGIRILCDFLTVMGFLTKHEFHYGLTPDAAMF